MLTRMGVTTAARSRNSCVTPTALRRFDAEETRDLGDFPYRDRQFGGVPNRLEIGGGERSSDVMVLGPTKRGLYPKNAFRRQKLTEFPVFKSRCGCSKPAFRNLRSLDGFPLNDSHAGAAIARGSGKA
jgi:hypothetical protein